MLTRRFWLAPTLLAVGLITPAAHSFSLFDWFKPNPQKTFQQHAPADTVFYMEGEYSFEQFPNLYNGQAYHLQMEMLLKQLNRDNSALDKETTDTLLSLIADYLGAVSQGPQAFAEQYGLADNLAYALYMDGLYPVLHLALEKNNETFAQRFTAFLQQSGATTDIVTVQGTEVHRTVFELPEASESLALAWVQKGDIGTVALVDASLPEARMADIMALQAEQHSLFDAKTVPSLKQTYDYSDESVGFLDIVALTTSLVSTDATKMAVDLQLQTFTDFDTNQSETCQTETINIAEQLPRVVFGSKAYKSTSETLQSHQQFTLELTDTDVKSELGKLNGYLAGHALNATDNLIGVAFGSDFAQLAPVVGSLWGNLTRADVSCDALIELQDALLVANPVASLQAAAVLNGVKGYAFSLFDIRLDDNFQPIDIDALVTVTADNPMLFVNLAKSFLPLQGLDSIEQGREVEIAIPDDTIDKVYVFVGDDHIGIYTGEKGRTAYHAETDSSQSKDGVIALSMNYGNYMKTALPLFDQFATASSIDYETCLSSQLSFMTVQNLKGELSYHTGFDTNGITTDLQVNLLTNEPLTPETLPGTYRVETLSDACQWEAFGDETIAKDNTGFYDLVYAGDSCSFERYGYQWNLDGLFIDVVDTAYFAREQCGSEWAEQLKEIESAEDSGYRCTVLSHYSEGFICSIPFEDSYDLYRYTRQ